METLLQDLRYGVRTLVKNPGFTVVAVLALALGIGANTAIFSVVRAVLLKSLPYGDPGRIVFLWDNPPGQTEKYFPESPRNFQDLRAQSQSFKYVAARVQQTFNITVGGDPERIVGEAVTEHYFDILSIKPVMGRFLLPSDGDTTGNSHVVVLTRRLWERRFGSDSTIIGRNVLLNDENYTVVGIAPDDHRVGIDLWVPLLLSTMPDDRSWHALQVIARLKDGVPVEQAAAEMRTFAGRLSTEYPKSNQGWTIGLAPMHEVMVKNIRPALLVLVGAVAFVLLIACANVANLLLARVGARQREIAIRTALGARRGRLVRQLLTESVLLSCIGGGLGILLAVWGTDLISKLKAVGLPRATEIGVDGWVLMFAVGLSVGTGLLFGLLPALQSSKPDLVGPLKDGGRANSGGIRGRKIRNMLVLAEVALALLLLIGAGLMIRSFATLAQVEPGFDSSNVLAVDISLPERKYSDSAKQVAFYDNIIKRVAALPGVESAATISALPLAAGGPQILFMVEGRPIPNPADAPSANTRFVSPDYFRTMRIPVLKGRAFTDRDDFGSQPVGIVNETMAKQLWPGEDPIGKRMTLGIASGTDSVAWTTIVGVVGDVHHQALNSEGGLEFYVNYKQAFLIAQAPSITMSLVARTTGDPVALAPAVRREVAAIDSDIPLAAVRSMDDVVATSIAQPRLYMLLLSIFAGVALLLAAIGIYGVIAQMVTQRTHEIGIRMALGAGRREVLAMVVRQGMSVAGIGVVAGLAGAFAMTRLMEALLYGVSATDPITFVGVAFLLALVALVACYIPARRAAGIDPMNALRYE